MKAGATDVREGLSPSRERVRAAGTVGCCPPGRYCAAVPATLRLRAGRLAGLALGVASVVASGAAATFFTRGRVARLGLGSVASAGMKGASARRITLSHTDCDI